MSYVVINAITVPSERRDVLEERFAARAGEVSNSPGFEAFELLRPENDAAGDKYLVYTRWDKKESFEAWMSGASFQRGHKGSEEARPAATGNEVWFYGVVQQEYVSG
jgi:heme oxygenase (mycobilin-producing)